MNIILNTELSPLSRRQNAVLLAIAQALTNNNISKQLQISCTTINRHCEAIYQRMHINTEEHNARVLLITTAIAKGILRIEEV